MSKSYRGPFAKIYKALWDGTLGPNAEAWTTWVLMLAHADAEGVVEMTPDALAARGGLDPDWVRRGLAVLEAPDPESRTAELDGRRVVRLDDHRSWGWRIVNHGLYRNQTDAERARSYRTRRVTPRDANVTNVTQRHQAEAEVRGIESTELPELAPLVSGDSVSRLTHLKGSKAKPVKARLPKGEPEGFLPWYESYPRHVARLDAARAYRQMIHNEKDAETLVANTRLWAKRWFAEDRAEEHVKHPATFLRSGQWQDPPEED